MGALLLLLLFVAHPRVLSAQGVDVQVSADSIVVGDSVGVTLRVDAPGGWDVFHPLIPDTLGGGLDRIGESRWDTLSNNDTLFSATLQFPVSAYDSGVYLLPSIPFILLHDGVSDTLYSRPSLLYVAYAQRDSAVADIMPLVGPLEQGLTLAEALPWVVGGLVLLAIAVLAYYLLRRRRRADEPVVDPRRLVPADEYALGVLEAQLHDRTWRNPGVKHFFTEVSGALRFFMGEVWGIRAMEGTTEEILGELDASAPCTRGQRETVRRILELSDQVKFAKYVPLEHECTQVAMDAIGLVREVGVPEGNVVESDEAATGASLPIKEEE
ncbi:MAG: hypothetical protein CSA07_01635 [Bacteroidia bacterium]|nr:MAG: hypothetical protein CSA07_01635 [Bacteroidia bacterium]